MISHREGVYLSTAELTGSPAMKHPRSLPRWLRKVRVRFLKVLTPFALLFESYRKYEMEHPEARLYQPPYGL